MPDFAPVRGRTCTRSWLAIHVFCCLWACGGQPPTPRDAPRESAPARCTAVGSTELEEIELRYDAALERLDAGDQVEARDAIRAVLCADLPTFAQRAQRELHLDLSRDIEAIAAQYVREAADHPLLARYGEDRVGAWAQGGAFVLAERRFIPLTPVVHESRDGLYGDMGIGIVAPMVDLDARRAIVVTGRGSDSEGGGLERGAARLYEVPTGRLVVRTTPETPDQGIYLAALAGDHALIAFDIDPDPLSSLDAEGVHPTTEKLPNRHLRVWQTFWYPVRLHDRYAVRDGALVLPVGRTALPRDHVALTDHVLHVAEPAGIAVLVSADAQLCASPDHYVVDRIDLRTQRIDRVVAADGLVAVQLEDDGTLFVQTREGTRVYERARGPGQPLPRNVGISGHALPYNSGC